MGSGDECEQWEVREEVAVMSVECEVRVGDA